MLICRSVIFSISIFFSVIASGYSLKSTLREFHENPNDFYMRHTLKYDKDGVRINRSVLKAKDISVIQERKMTEREKYFNFSKLSLSKKLTVGVTSPPGDNDQADRIVDGGHSINNIFTLNSLGLSESKLNEAPWSADYWPTYRGLLGSRFLDDSYPYTLNWMDYYDYVNQYDFFSIYKSSNLKRINKLAVSEKYDLLLGTNAGVLTQGMWAQGKSYYELYGNVETWMGICHGWAAAAVSVPRPRHSIEVLAYDGKTKLRFNPSELKGLVSYAWANNSFAKRFIGGRCNFKDVERDENGRPFASQCHDTNPATWYVSIVNQIGIARRGFVMDATADYEVWNQPVFGYKIHYFNPQTLEPQNSIEAAIVKKDFYTRDVFKMYRAQSANQFIGVSMDVMYSAESTANNRAFDTAENDNVTTVRYVFDLELDMNGNIIGGEWYQNEHPDFIWVPDIEAIANTSEDAEIVMNDWDGKSILPSQWKSLGERAAHKNQVLNAVVMKLLEKAQ